MLAPELLRCAGPSAPAALVIRHAERPAILVEDGYRMTGLTDKGLEDALELGSAISQYFDSYRLFYSPVKRCLQTAEMVHQGLLKAGKQSEFCGPENLLGISYMTVDMDTGFGISERFGNSFIRAWFEGELEPNAFMPLEKTLGQHLEYLRNKMASSPGLDIHVTHDWNLNVLREGIFKIRHEDIGWPGFLYPVLISNDSGGLKASIPNGGKGCLSASIPL